MTRLKSGSYKYLWNYGGLDFYRIYFYDESGIVFKSTSGYLQPLHDIKNVYSYDDNDRFELEISGYLQQRNKLNLTRKEHFFIKDTTSSYETKLNVYLYVGADSEFKFEKVDEVKVKKSFQSYEATTYHYEVCKLSGKYILEPVYLAQLKSYTTRKTKIGKQADELVNYLSQKKFYDLDKYEMSQLLTLCNVTIK